MNRFSIALLIIAASPFVTAEQAQQVMEAEIQDYVAERGIGCVSKRPMSNNAQFFFVCRSRRSVESAWNAALYRGKLACNGTSFSVLFNVPPGLPKEGDVFVAQVELSCKRA